MARSDLRRRERLSKEKSNKSPSLARQLCEHFPQDLIEMVLNRLSLRHLVACRTICKSWNAYILSTRSPPAPVSKTTLVYFPPNGDFRHQSLTVYNDKTKNWEMQCLSFLAAGGVSGPYSLVSVDGGLLCFCDSSLTNLVVCNPVSKQWRRLEPPGSVLPELPGMEIVGCPHNYVLVGMAVNEEEGSYKLVLAGLTPLMTACKTMMASYNEEEKSSFTELESNSRRCFVYNSCSGSWNEAPPVPLLPNSELDSEVDVWCNECPRRSVVSDGKLYWSITEQPYNNPTREIVRFDIKTNEWCSEVADDDDLCDLVVVDGQVLLMKLWDGMKLAVDHIHQHGVRAFYSGIGNEICPTEWEYLIFEIQDAGSHIEFTQKRLPQALLDLKKTEQFTSKYYNQYGCIGQGTSLFVMHQVIDGDYRSWKMQGWRILHFDSSKDSCVWLPQLDTSRDEQFPVSFWTLRPSLRVLV